MKNYKRLTVKISKNASNASYDELLNRLAELEDKIENGTLVEIESPCTEEELEHELIRIEIQNMIRSLSVPGGYYSLHKPKQKDKRGRTINMKICKFYAETERRGWCSNVDCLLEKCYFDDNLNSCEFFEPTKCEKELYPSTLKYDKVETVKLMPDNGRPIDQRTLIIQNCDKIILKPKSLEVEVKIEKDNFDDFDFIEINGHKFKKV